MTVSATPELTQQQLHDMVRSYFRSLLIDSNERIFWLEDMWLNRPEDRAEQIEAAYCTRVQLEKLDHEGQAQKIFEGTVETQLQREGFPSIKRGSDSFDILCN